MLFVLCSLNRMQLCGFRYTSRYIDHQNVVDLCCLTTSFNGVNTYIFFISIFYYFSPYEPVCILKQLYFSFRHLIRRKLAFLKFYLFHIQHKNALSNLLMQIRDMVTVFNLKSFHFKRFLRCLADFHMSNIFYLLLFSYCLIENRYSFHQFF